MKKFINLIYREFKLFAQNQIAVLLFVVAPIAYALLLGLVYQDAKVTDLPIVVVDLDNTPLSNKVIEALDDNQYIRVQQVGEFSATELRNMIVREGIIGIVTIPNRFEADMNQKRHPEIDIDINAANMLNANYVSTGVMQVLGTLNAGIEIASLNKKGIPRKIALKQYEAFKISMNRHYNPSSNYLIFLFPGMLGTIMQQVFMLALALSFAKEFETGTFKNLLQESKSPSYLLLVKSIPYWILGIILWVPLFHFSSTAFHMPLATHKIPFWLVTSMFMVAVTAIGIAVSIALKTQLKATEVLMVIATPSFILSGQTWPSQQIPAWIQILADIIPLTHYSEAIRRLTMYKAETIDIMPQIQSLLIITIVSIIIAYILLKLKIKKELSANVSDFENN